MLGEEKLFSSMLFSMRRCGEEHVMRSACLFVPLLLLVVACTAPPSPSPVTISTGGSPVNQSSIERVSFTTADNVTIIGSYYDAPGDAVILLHQLNLDRTSWDAFAKIVQQHGYAALAIDLRGHGESAGHWQTFHDEDFQAMLLDAKAASTYLQSRNKRVMAILGASIGANTAFRYSADHKTPAILLSPGLTYHGIDINNVTSTAATLIIVSQGDTYAATSSQELEKNNLFGAHTLLIIPGNKHGTAMLPEPGVEDAMLSFLANNTVS